MAFSYRAATPTDATAICAFWNGPSGDGSDGAAAAVRALYPGEPKQGWNPVQIAGMMENRMRFALAMNGNAIVGFIAYTLARPPMRGMHIDIFAVAPRTPIAQSRTFARDLMRAVHPLLPDDFRVDVPTIPQAAVIVRDYLDARYSNVEDHEDGSRTYWDTVARLRTVE